MGFTGGPVNATVVLNWTNAPAQPTTYTVKRARTSGGPYAAIATGITEGVTATTYTDSAVTNGGTYYYVVSAVNASGEGPNSTQVVVSLPNANFPDVVITSIKWSPDPPFAGNHLIFRATVKNQGTAPTPAGTVLGVGFSIDGSANVSWSGSYSSALAPGASVTLTADGGPTGNYWTATAGAHSVTATADDINRFPESNEGNNAASAYLGIAATRPRVSGIAITNNTLTFRFNATSGLHYRTEFKSNLEDSQWQVLGPEVIANSSIVSVQDGLTNLHRFYRVLQLN
jgi:subtilase family serine protease